MHPSDTRSNALIHETSPYLLQHAHNPVNWQPWNNAALERARREDKPILLSIGYSACHWCHVMAHESFEDQATAQVMNELFVNIKVDREERPDLDRIYQSAHQMLAQRAGGWPLTMFLSPGDRTPFFGGTYFPKEPRYGMPAFADLCRRVAAYYHEHREDVTQQNAAVRENFRRLSAGGAPAGVQITDGVLARARAEIGGQFDPKHGGFGQAPKFPHPTTIERLLRHWAAHPDDSEALHMARFSLHAMASGGVYDQLGGGFCRYSVDEYWMIPHFEKMLYDNGQLLALYADAALATGDTVFQRIAIETAEWVMREMQSPDDSRDGGGRTASGTAVEGGYYSALDADSEGEEGKFYVWTPDEVRAVLTADEYTLFAPVYGIDRPPNFEGHAWNLHVFRAPQTVAEKLGLDAIQAAALLASARAKLLAARGARVRPGRDDKVLTSWNGLMIKGMARAGRLLGRADFIDSAERAFDFIRAQMWKDDHLLASYKDGRAHLNAYLDDYAFLLDAGLELLQAHWRDGDLGFLIELAETLLDRFEDKTGGGFFFTSDDHEQLIHRPKPASDEAIPSGNGVAAQALLRLGHLLGDSHYLDAAHNTLTALYRDIERYPSMHNALLVAVEEYLHPTQTIVLRGNSEALPAWQARCKQCYAPRRLTLAIPEDAKELPGILAQRVSKGGVTAYVCTGHACEAPVTELARLDVVLAATESPKA
ncbi:MAG TPA: thioredoxin domain-containing protein [Acidiferrobacterales bacterium]|nr:thioredoxin domain-containing protein [Acidiferrobacterales bacterium]